MTKPSKLCIRFLESEVLTAMTMKIISLLGCDAMLFGTNLFYFIYSHTPTPSHFNTEVYCVTFMGLGAVTMKIMTL
jgi:hypothetical protein